MASLDFRSEKLRFNAFYDDNLNKLKNAKNALLSIISSALIEEGLEVHTVTGRIKNKNECVRKFTLKYQAKLENEKVPYLIRDHINDLIGLRIVMLYESDIDKVELILRREFALLEKTDKSKILEEGNNTFGYKGLHLDMKLSEPRSLMLEYQPYANFTFEIQVRTIIQDAWSVLDHKIKYKKAIPKYLERRINSLSALFEIADREFLDIQNASKKEMNNAISSLKPKENINSFTFYKLIKKIMPDLPISESRSGEFVDYILSYGDLSYEELELYIEENQLVIKEFFDSMWEKIGENYVPDAFSYIIHILHFSAPQRYHDIIPGFSSTAFDDWLSRRSSKYPLAKPETLE